MRYLFLFLFLLFSGISNCQTVRSRVQYLRLSLSQIKESLNYGFVFSGPQIQYGRDWRWQKPNKLFELETSLGLSSVFSKGICIDFHAVPVNFSYLFKINEKLWLGPEILTEYNYEFYPDLQMGHDFWFSHYSTCISASFQKVLSTI